jgi:uroporphyrinogen-III synthase
MNDLKNLHVLVTRPLPQGGIFCEKINAEGGNAIYLPTLEFAPPQNKIESIKMAEQYDWIIFISQEAVERSIMMIRKRWPIFPVKTRIATIGEGTAQALQKKGIESVVFPAHDWTSEGLLDLDFFKEVKQQKILLVRGEGGRELLAETLIARGAHVDHLPVYRRQMPVYANINKYLELLRQKKIDIIVCTSGESLHNLMTIIGAANHALLVDVAMIVVSERLVALAKTYHFQRVFRAKNASHDAIIDTLSFIKRT